MPLVGHCRRKSVGGDIFFVFRHSVMVFSVTDYPAARTFFGREAIDYLRGLREFRGLCFLCLLSEEETGKLVLRTIQWFDEFEKHLSETSRRAMEMGIERIEDTEELPKELRLQLKVLRIKLISLSALLPREKCREFQTAPEVIDGSLHVEMVNERLRRLRES